MKLLYLEACDFISYPLGGTLSFSKHLISTNIKQVFLVGFVNDDEPVGRWFVKEINGVKFDFFGICRVSEIKKSILPKRLYSLWSLFLWIKDIIKVDFATSFTQSPQFVFILYFVNLKEFVFLFPGLGNSVGLSKFRFLRIFNRIYESLLFFCLKSMNAKILAASDIGTIKKVEQKFKILSGSIVQFPTRYDPKVFFPKDKLESRIKLGINRKHKIFIVVGRLSYIKGWKLIVDTFRVVKYNNKDSILLFIGSGEEEFNIRSYCSNDIKDGSIIMLGRKNPEDINLYINSSDCFVMGSLEEGWPTSMVEALACGIPLVSTNVSGASEMIKNSLNGYILNNRDSKDFSILWEKSLALEKPNSYSLMVSKKYSLDSLSSDFIAVLNN